MRAMKSRDLADRSDEERDSVCILPALKQTSFLSILWKCHRKRNPEIGEKRERNTHYLQFASDQNCTNILSLKIMLNIPISSS